jgi:LysR family nitrogen assimilation transcriptional regulator
LDLRQLQYFLCVYEELNITRAAAKLNVVQPAVSMQIRKLEEEFGARLFERTARGVMPTPAGRAIYELYLPILLDLQAAKQRAMELSGGVFGKFTVGVALSVANSVLGLTLSRYSAGFPNVEVRIEESNSETLIQRVAAGELDLAVTNKVARRGGLQFGLLLAEELLLVRRAQDHDGAADVVRFGELAKLKLILPNSRAGFRSIVERAAADANLEIVPMLEIDSPIAALDLVATNADLSEVLPASTLRRFLRTTPFRLQRIVDPGLSRELVCVYRTRAPLSPPAKEFLALLKAELIDAAAEVGRVVVGR